MADLARPRAGVLLDRSLRLSEHGTALEVGWLLAELEQRFGYGLDELARRFDRSVSWVSRRLALVEVLPEAIQQQVREGRILAQTALKFLVPVARQNLEDCQRMWRRSSRSITASTREAGQLYGACGAKVHRRAANAFWMIPGCFSKRSGRRGRKFPPERAPNCCAIWKNGCGDREPRATAGWQ